MTVGGRNAPRPSRRCATSTSGAVEPFVLGIDFGGTKVAVATCDLDGRRLASETIETRSDDGAEIVLQRGIRAAETMIADLGATHQLVAAGVSTIGVPLEHSIELAPAIPGWGKLPLRARIEHAFEVPTRVATDVKAAAMAEARWGALKGADPAIYLNLGTGLAAAIVCGGEVVHGAHGASGEIGYNLTSRDQVGVAIGERGTLEDSVSGMGLAADGARLIGRPVTALEVFEAAEHHAELNALVDELIEGLALHLVNLVIAIDPERVVIGGGMVRSWERIHPPLEHALKAGVPFPPELVRAAQPFDAALIGALALGVQVAAVPDSDDRRETGD